MGTQQASIKQYYRYDFTCLLRCFENKLFLNKDCRRVVNVYFTYLINLFHKTIREDIFISFKNPLIELGEEITTGRKTKGTKSTIQGFQLFLC